MRYTSYEFYCILNDCYFHPDNLKNYPSKAIMRKARIALIKLWNTQRLKIFGIHIPNSVIRYVLLNEMMPEHVIKAISFFMKHSKRKTVFDFAVIIFLVALSSEKVAEIKFNRDKYLISNQNNFVVTIIFVVRGEVNVFSKQEDTKLLSPAQ